PSPSSSSPRPGAAPAAFDPGAGARSLGRKPSSASSDSSSFASEPPTASPSDDASSEGSVTSSAERLPLADGNGRSSASRVEGGASRGGGGVLPSASMLASSVSAPVSSPINGREKNGV